MCKILYIEALPVNEDTKVRLNETYLEVETKVKNSKLFKAVKFQDTTEYQLASTTTTNKAVKQINFINNLQKEYNADIIGKKTIEKNQYLVIDVRPLINTVSKQTNQVETTVDTIEKITLPDIVNLTLPIGIAGSGKSTWIKSLPKDTYTIISPDEIRRNLTGSISDQSKNIEVFKETDKQVIEAIKEGKQVVLDATNTRTDFRRSFLQTLRGLFSNIRIAYKIIDSNPEISKQRIKKDIESGMDRAAVPEEIVDKQYEQYLQTLEDVKLEGMENFDKLDNYFQLKTNIETNTNNPVLDALVLEFAKNFGITKRDLTEFQNKHNLDIVAVSDIFNKVIYLSKNRNIETVPEEVGHFIIYLLGNNNDMVKELMSNISNWSEYSKIYTDYIDIYKSEERVRFEAVGKLIAKHIVREFENSLDKSFFRKILDKIYSILQKKILLYDTANNYAQKIASKIIRDQIDLIPKNIDAKFVKVDYEKAFEKYPEEKALNEFIQKNNGKLTGSLAISVQGDIFRDANESIHDLDYTVDTKDKRDFLISKLIDEKNAIEIHSGISFVDDLQDYKTRSFIVPHSGYKIVQYDRRKDGTINRNSVVVHNLKNNKYYLYHESILTIVDLFLDDTGTNYKDFSSLSSVFEGKYGLSPDSDVFLRREKDQKDYVLLNPIEEVRNYTSSDRFLYYQTNINKDSNKTLKEKLNLTDEDINSLTIEELNKLKNCYL